MVKNLAQELVENIPVCLFQNSLPLRAFASFWEIPLDKGAGDLDSGRGQ